MDHGHHHGQSCIMDHHKDYGIIKANHALWIITRIMDLIMANHESWTITRARLLMNHGQLVRPNEQPGRLK
eukprot:1142459-Pelagomonas_calceolata.AAC.7